MFAKSEWFKLTHNRSGIAPSGWMGWAYVAAWAVVIVLPAFTLAGRPGQKLEALIWLVAMGGLFLWERRDLSLRLRGIGSPAVRTPTVTASATNIVRTGHASVDQTVAGHTPSLNSTKDIFYIGDDDQHAAGEEYVFRLRR